MRRLLLLPLLLFTGCTPLWIAPNGLDSNPGTEAQPKRTLAGACNAAGSDKLITMKAGTYPEQVIPSSCAGSQIGEDGQAVIRAGSPSSTTPTLDVQASDVTINDIQVSSNFHRRKATHVSSPRVTMNRVDLGNVTNDKALEVVADDFVIDASYVHDARFVTDGTEPHLECAFVHEADGSEFTNTLWRNCGIYDIAFTRCTWCNPVPPTQQNITIEGNQFYHSHQEWGQPGWHYAEVSFYPFMQSATGFTVRNNFFETQSVGNPGRGGIDLQTSWVGGTRCGNTESPGVNELGAVWKASC